MAIGDITFLQQDTSVGIGARLFNVAASATLINAGEPVATTAGGVAVTPAATNTPVVGTDYYVGIAATTSTNTASAAGTVNVYPLIPGVVYLIKPAVAATWDTQTEYDALVGKRVLIDLTTGSYTLLASDSALNGCVVMAMNVLEHPGRVAFGIKDSVYFLNGSK